MAYFATATPQIKKSVSCGSFEKERVFKMEEALMKHYGYNFSQLHKTLVRDAYQHLKLI